MNPSVSEQAIINFYEFDYLGRGYYHFPFPVELEPPYLPFLLYKKVKRQNDNDDGKVPSFFKRISNIFLTHEIEDDVDDDFEIKPIPSRIRPDNIALELSFQVQTHIDKNLFKELLNMISYSKHNISFEIIGTHEKISIQLVCSDIDAIHIESHINAYLPKVTINKSSAFNFHLKNYENIAICDFGLEEEFARPLSNPQNFNIDSLTSFFASLETLIDGDIIIYQVLFKGVKNPWSKGIINSVTDFQGKSFFVDAPEMPQLAKIKTTQPLFSVVLRLAVQSQTKERGRYLAETIIQGISRTSESEYNRLIPLNNEGYLYQNHVENLFHRQSNRLGMVLNTDELVSLVHYPNVYSQKLGFDDAKTKLLPKECTDNYLKIGINKHNGIEKEVTLSVEQQLRHAHIIGSTGVGKSTLIANMFLRQINNGHGGAIFDPHGDIIEDIILRIPEHRKDDVIIIDPSDSEFPIGFNLLHAETDVEKIVLSSDLVSSFKRHATAWGDNMTAVLSNAINTFLENKNGGTLIELKRFLIEDKFRNEFLKNVDDNAIHYYWKHEYPLVKKRIAPLLTRIDTFLRPKIVRYMLAQKSGVDFKDCIENKKIILFKLSQGLIGESNSFLLASLFLSKINQSAQSRQNIPKEQRFPYFIYLDEFHSFITLSITSMLSGARKYGLSLTLAHQELAQIDDAKVLNSVISNPNIRICFRTGSDSDARKLENGFSYFEQSDLQNLNIGEAIMKVGSSSNDFNLHTFKLPPINDDAKNIREFIIQNTRNKYAKPVNEIKDILDSLLPQVINPSKQKEKITKIVTHEPEVITETKKIKEKVEIQDESISKTKFDKQKESFLKQESKQDSLRKHRSLQNFVRTMALQRGFNVSIEKETQEGGRVDVSLIRDSVRIAVEISVTNSVEYEVKNIQKCINENYNIILMVSENTKHLQKIKKLSKEIIESKLQKNIFYIAPNEISLHLDIINTPKGKTPTKRVNGWRVKVSYHPDDNQHKNQNSLSKRIRNSLK